MHFQFYTPPQVRAHPSPVATVPGVYVIGSRSSALVPGTELGRSSIAMPDAYRAIYIGSAANLQRRIKCHVGSNSIVSSFRGSLGALIGQELGLTAMANELGGSIWFKEEMRLSEWIDQSCLIGITESPGPLALERRLVREEQPPLNIEFIRTTPAARNLIEARAAIRASARAAVSTA